MECIECYSEKNRIIPWMSIQNLHFADDKSKLGGWIF